MARIVSVHANSPYAAAVGIATLDDGRFAVGSFLRAGDELPRGADTYGDWASAERAQRVADRAEAAADEAPVRAQWYSTGHEGALDDGPS